jgi:hypothetical protein
MGLLLFAFTAWVWQHPNRNADLLGGLIMALVVATIAGLGLYRLIDRLFSRRRDIPDEAAQPPTPQPPAGPVCLQRNRPSVEGVLLFWGVALFWNVPMVAAVAGTIQLGLQGRWVVALIVFVAIFGLVGLVLIAWAVYTMLEEFPRLRGLPSAQVELSIHPLSPGGAYELEARQPGPVHLRALQVLLVCEVQQVFTSDDGEKSDKLETVYQAELAREEELHIDEVPYTARLRFSVPADARPSRDDPGGVRWRVVVKGRRAGWPVGFAFDFPLTVVAPDEPPGPE